MKRKLIDDFDGITASKAPRLEHPATLPIPVLPQRPYTHQPMPTDLDLHNVMRNFVNIYEKLDPSDEPLVKPNYSYTELVYLAVLRSPNFCLPIGEIYRYVQSRFAFFRNNTRLHWRNAIRHSLSKTKCFTKISLGRGANSGSNRSCFLWTIIPSSIINFARGDYRPNVDRDSGTNTLRWGYYHTNAGNFWDQVAVVLENKMEIFKDSVTSCISPTKMFQQQLCDLPTQQVENFTPAAPQTITSRHHVDGTTSSCQSPTVSPTPQSTCLQSTPPPNVVCQPNGQIYCNSATPSYNSYSSSTPISYNVVQRNVDVRHESGANMQGSATYTTTSPVIQSYDRQNYAFTPTTPSTYGTSCYQTVSPVQSDHSYLENSTSNMTTQLWNQQSPDSSGTSSCQISFEKDSGIDLESFSDAIHEWIPIYQTDSKPVYLASGTQIDLSSTVPTLHTDALTSGSVLPEFPTFVPDNLPLDLSATALTESSSAKISDQYENYTHVTYPEYNFNQYVNTIPDRVYSFCGETNNYPTAEWFQN